MRLQQNSVSLLFLPNVSLKNRYLVLGQSCLLLWHNGNVLSYVRFAIQKYGTVPATLSLGRPC